VVQQLAVHTVGGGVTPAQELMVIVPANSGLEIEAMILNKDKAWVTTKQDAEIKVESFPFTKFGTIDGKVAIVSGDAVQDENLGLVYPIRVTMAKTTILSGSEHVTLSPGMNVTIEVKTGKRRLIEYLLAPLQRYQDESMRER
ncbi:MAG: HlyD family efflux transporter periplasmic adaptor subunit, partial [Rhodospirillales bacterium]|nr:HlyD family efflux transporter periplasmic adaptor subunit [Rhodospirillales bacterium]